eukprot:4678298-Pyramimonas_sp.AAC.1
MAGQPAPSSAGAPAPDDDRVYAIYQDTKGISHSINEGTLSYAIQSILDNTLKTWCRRNAVF